MCCDACRFLSQEFSSGMSPRDIWDMNPIFSMAFDSSYRDMIESLGFEVDVHADAYVEDTIPPLIEDDAAQVTESSISEFDRYYESWVEQQTDGYWNGWWDMWLDEVDRTERDIAGLVDGIHDGIPVGMLRATPESSDWGSDDELGCLEDMDEYIRRI